MDQLAEAARGFGAYALGVETTLDNLQYRQGRFACIALLEKGHFVNVYDVDGDQVLVIDPPTKRTMNAGTFRTLWTGKALLISDEPIGPLSARRWLWIGLGGVLVLGVLALGGRRITKRSKVLTVVPLLLLAGCLNSSQRAPAPPGIPVIEVEPKELDPGTADVSLGAELKARIQIANTGPARLHMRPVQSSCGCTVLQPPRRDLDPGSKDQVGVVVKVGYQAGPRSAVVSIASDDPVRPKVDVAVRWHARSRITLEPSELDFGALQAGERVRKEIKVRLT